MLQGNNNTQTPTRIPTYFFACSLSNTAYFESTSAHSDTVPTTLEISSPD